MRILYIGNYKDGTGWGNAALGNIEAMLYAGLDVVCRPITFNNFAVNNVSDAIIECENKPLTGIDVCIQHTLPPLYNYNGNFKNICIYETETNDFGYSMWPKYINMMDEAWVSNRDVRRASMNSGVTIPVKIAPHTIILDKYKKHTMCTEITELNNSFNFVFTGEMVKRKNLMTLIKAFHIAFDYNDNVNLLLKLNHHILSADEILNSVFKFNEDITAGLKLRSRYKQPVVMAGYIEESKLYSIMKQCHYFITTSYGEARCIPAIEANALGIPVIYTDNAGMEGLWGIPIPSKRVSCCGSMDSLPEIYSAYDSWREIDLDYLVTKMKFAYNNYNQGLTPYSKENCILAASKFDISETSKKIKGLLDEC